MYFKWKNMTMFIYFNGKSWQRSPKWMQTTHTSTSPSSNMWKSREQSAHYEEIKRAKYITRHQQAPQNRPPLGVLVGSAATSWIRLAAAQSSLFVINLILYLHRIKLEFAIFTRNNFNRTPKCTFNRKLKISSKCGIKLFCFTPDDSSSYFW